MDPRLRELLADQSGVVARRQLHEVGLAPHDVKRLVRRRELTPLHAGVYLDHTGEATFLQRAWGGVLLYPGAALAGETALRATEGPGSRRVGLPVDLVVGEHRHVTPRDGVTVTRTPRFEERVLWNVGPPRLRYEEAAIDVASRCSSDFAAVGELSRAVQSRRTTAEKMRRALDGRNRLPRRSWMSSVLSDVAVGTCSVLEHGYLDRVERPHGLRGARRQVRDRMGPGTIYRDVLYEGGLVVELDGRLHHDTTAQRDRDFDRDLEAAVAGLDTVRLSYGQVFERSCWTAGRIGLLLVRRGGPRARPCGPGCLV